jgi:hypothetical protein
MDIGYSVIVANLSVNYGTACVCLHDSPLGPRHLTKPIAPTRVCVFEWKHAAEATIFATLASGALTKDAEIIFPPGVTRMMAILSRDSTWMIEPAPATIGESIAYAVAAR